MNLKWTKETFQYLSDFQLHHLLHLSIFQCSRSRCEKIVLIHVKAPNLAWLMFGSKCFIWAWDPPQNELKHLFCVFYRLDLVSGRVEHKYNIINPINVYIAIIFSLLYMVQLNCQDIGGKLPICLKSKPLEIKRWNLAYMFLFLFCLFSWDFLRVRTALFSFTNFYNSIYMFLYFCRFFLYVYRIRFTRLSL